MVAMVLCLIILFTVIVNSFFIDVKDIDHGCFLSLMWNSTVVKSCSVN